MWPDSNLLVNLATHHQHDIALEKRHREIHVKRKKYDETKNEFSQTFRDKPMCHNLKILFLANSKI